MDARAERERIEEAFGWPNMHRDMTRVEAFREIGPRATVNLERRRIVLLDEECNRGWDELTARIER